MESWNYETKCRRCGKLHDWWFADKINFDWLKFVGAMNDHLVNPRSYKCDDCKKETVQDVVSYPGPHD